MTSPAYTGLQETKCLVSVFVSKAHKKSRPGGARASSAVTVAISTDMADSCRHSETRPGRDWLRPWRQTGLPGRQNMEDGTKLSILKTK